jgi:hypothetical protein
VPADIVVTGNHIAKPLRWRTGTPGAEVTAWTVKNLFELKNARRVLVDGNLLENNWLAAQNGFAVLFTVRNQDGRAPWSVVEDVTFSNNVVRHVGAGVNILGRDDIHPSQQTRRIAISGNLFDDVGGPWGSGRLFRCSTAQATCRFATTRRRTPASCCSGAITPRTSASCSRTTSRCTTRRASPDPAPAAAVKASTAISRAPA